MSTQATSTKSTPRVTPYSLSVDRLACLRCFFDLEVGEGEEAARLRFFLFLLEDGSSSESEASPSEAGSRWVEVTGKVLVDE